MSDVTKPSGSAAIMRSVDGLFIFHERDDDAPIAPGLIGVFGGGSEENETPEETIIRELKEELELEVMSADISEIGIINHSDERTYSTLFFIDNINPQTLTLHEGKSIQYMTLDEFLEVPNSVTKLREYISNNLKQLKNL